MKDEEIVETLKRENEEFKKLDEEHRSFEALLSEIDRKARLTTEEEIERKKLQKRKLAGKDRMAEIIREYKKSCTN